MKKFSGLTILLGLTVAAVITVGIILEVSPETFHATEPRTRGIYRITLGGVLLLCGYMMKKEKEKLK